MPTYVGMIPEPDGELKIEIFTDWPSCERYTSGIPAAWSRKFDSKTEAKVFCDDFKMRWEHWAKMVRLNEIPTAYVDGGCSVKKQKASWGLAVYAPEGSLLHEDCGVVGDDKSPIPIKSKEYTPQRQVAGELYGAVKAIEWARNNKPVIIGYDYAGIMYHALDIWPPKRPLQYWYAGVMKDHHKLVLAWRWIRGHTGVKGNEHADALARRAIENL